MIKDTAFLIYLLTHSGNWESGNSVINLWVFAIILESNNKKVILDYQCQ